MLRVDDELWKFAVNETNRTALTDISADTITPNSANQVDQVYQIALKLQENGNTEAAETIHRQLLSIREEGLGSSHPDTIRSRDSLLVLLRKPGRYAEALDLQRQSLAAKEATLGPEHPDTLMAIHDLAEVLRKRDQFQEARDLSERVLNLRTDILGPVHPDTIRSMSALAQVLRHQDELQKSKDLFQKVLVLQDQQLGPDHPDIIATVQYLALIHVNEGMPQQAEEMLRRLLATNKNADDYHPSTWATRSNLSWALLRQGKCAEAETIERRLWPALATRMGPDAPPALGSMRSLIEALGRQGKFDEAESLVREGLVIVHGMDGEEQQSELNAMKELEVSLVTWKRAEVK